MIVSVALFIIIIIVLATEFIKYLKNNIIVDHFNENDIHKFHTKNQEYGMPYWI